MPASQSPCRACPQNSLKALGVFPASGSQSSSPGITCSIPGGKKAGSTVPIPRPAVRSILSISSNASPTPDGSNLYKSRSAPGIPRSRSVHPLD